MDWKKWILPVLCLVLNAALLYGNIKLHQSNVAMHEENVAFFKQNEATQNAFEHRYDGYETHFYEVTGLEDYPEKMQQAEENKYYEKRELMYLGMESGPTDVVFVGDSQTDRCAWEEFYPNLNVKRRAIVGDTIFGVRSRVDTVLMTEPSKIFLLVGTNDLYALSREKHPEAETMEDILAAYGEVLDAYAAGAPEAKVYVESVLPMRELEGERADYNEYIMTFNEQLKTLCEDKQVTYIDLWSRLVDEEGVLGEDYTLDGLHLSAKAYAVMKQEIDTYIEE